MAQQLRALVALTEELGSVSSLHMIVHGIPNFSPRGADILF